MSWLQLKRSQFFCSTWDGFRKELPKVNQLAAFAEEADDSFDNSDSDDDDDGNNNDVNNNSNNDNGVNNDSNNDNGDSFDNINFDYDDNSTTAIVPTVTSKIFDNYFAICNTASF